MDKAIEKIWNNYSNNYNTLVEKMIEIGLNIELLDNVINSYAKVINYEDIKTSYQSFYQSEVK